MRYCAAVISLKDDALLDELRTMSDRRYLTRVFTLTPNGASEAVRLRNVAVKGGRK
jgi:hypothetical protein